MNRTYEEILRGMLDRAPEDIDKREGSVIYDALAPTAYFLAQQDFQLEHFPDLVFLDTAVGDYLDRIADAHNVLRKKATASRRKIKTSGAVPIGTRWAINELIFVISAELTAGESYEAECETKGDIGNRYKGAMQPVSNVTGVTAELSDVITAGMEEEADNALRERVYDVIRKPSTSGNRYDYYNWAMECEGIGAAKVFPLANGPGTVKVIIADANMSAAGTGILKMVREHIEELRPIGADVTVASVVEKAVNVSAGIKLQAGMNLGVVQNAFQAALTEYLHKEALDLSYVSLARVGNLLLGTEGVEDYSNLLLNGVSGNMALTEEEIAVTGTVTLEVM
uniref:baseplate J/gp47 family protein n=1 Tax=Enterocloster clostridioformis TaxID=1531 RepID=UPI002A82EE43|nr:baseplate J/gp47 family protein [Enterocloster clostridioformis]